MKALIISEPWLGLILSGKKIWEMRKTACHHRGQIALIRKGSGQVVGTARISGSLRPLDNLDSYCAAEPTHCIPLDRQAQAFGNGWRTPWVIENAHPLTRPVRYAHSPGAVIWVNLAPDVANDVAAQLGSLSAAEPPKPAVIPPTTAQSASSARGAQPVVSPASPPPAGTERDVTITGGNLRNQHIYLPLDFFPTDAIGGGNKGEAAERTITVTFHPGVTVRTDIDRTKRILRARSQVGDFLKSSGVREGEAVRITCTSPYTYEFSKLTHV